MSQSASQAAVFYRQVAKEKKLWTVKDIGGFPAPKASTGERTMPFWSSLSRVQKIIKTVPAYAGFEPHEISLEDFTNKWIPGLIKDETLVGVNWSGAKAAGYDLEPESVKEAVEYYLVM